MGEIIDKAHGKTKEVIGSAKGDRKLEAEGKAQQRLGQLKASWEKFKREVKEASHRTRGRREAH